MNCANSRELLIEYSLGQLDATRAREVHEHVQGGCKMCAKELAEINKGWAKMAAALEPVPPSPEVEAKLLAMIRGDVLPAVRRTGGPVSKQGSQGRLIGYILAASLAGVMAGLVATNFTPLGSLLARRQVEDEVAQMWGAASSQRSTTGFQTVALNTIAEKRGVRVSVVMIPRTKEWHVIATGLPTLQNGEKLQVWLENKSGEITRSAVLAIEKAGRGGAVVDMAGVDVTDLSAVWLTEEAGGNSLRPSEAVLFRAALK